MHQVPLISGFAKGLTLLKSKARKGLDQSGNKGRCYAKCSLSNNWVRKQLQPHASDRKHTLFLVSLELKNTAERQMGVENHLSQTQLLSWTQGQKDWGHLNWPPWQFAPIKNLVTDCFCSAVSLPAEKPLLRYVWQMHITAGQAEIQSLSTAQGREKKEHSQFFYARWFWKDLCWNNCCFV